MEKIPCIFCMRSGNRKVISERGFQGLKCDECKIIYISPRPEEEEIERLYSESRALDYADAQYAFEGHGKREASKALSIIHAIKSRGALLELGSGGGAFLRAARDVGYDPYGIELNPIEANWINETLHIPCESKALNDRTFGGRTFDIVYHKDVLSHLRDPLDTFNKINRVLSESGLHVFETGNIADVEERRLGLFSEFHYPDHLFFFGEESILSLLKRTGFRCLTIYRVPILLPILLEKALSSFRSSLIDYKNRDIASLRTRSVSPISPLDLKRYLRRSYRYVYYQFTKLSSLLPQKGWPLKLLVVSVKE